MGEVSMCLEGRSYALFMSSRVSLLFLWICVVSLVYLIEPFLAPEIYNDDYITISMSMLLT